MKICPTCLAETKRLYKLDTDIDLMLCMSCKRTYQNYEKLYSTSDSEELMSKDDRVPVRVVVKGIYTVSIFDEQAYQDNQKRYADSNDPPAHNQIFFDKKDKKGKRSSTH